MKCYFNLFATLVLRMTRECERGLSIHMNFRALAERIVIPPTWRSETLPSHFVVNKSRRTRMDFEYNHEKIEMVILELYGEIRKGICCTEMSRKIFYTGMLIFFIYNFYDFLYYKI